MSGYDPDEFYAPVPAAGVFDSPGVSLCLNTEWASHIDGLIGQLLRRSAWAGTETEVDAAIQEVHKLLDKLADVGECQSGGTMTLPVGTIVAFGGAAAPAGWLLCDGDEVSRTTYAALFEVLGLTYGPGDGFSTFTLPDLRGRIAVGAGQGYGLSNHIRGQQGGVETHTLTVAEMPAHTHGYRRLLTTGADRNLGAGSTWNHNGVAVSDSVGGGAAHNNMQPYIVTNYIIYAAQ